MENEHLREVIVNEGKKDEFRGVLLAIMRDCGGDICGVIEKNDGTLYETYTNNMRFVVPYAKIKELNGE